MMQRPSPPRHRHDGTSPLPLGMDWSPPPRKWNGRDTIWPHDPHTGWSYCVTIPSWVVRPKTRDSDPVVFYRVQIGIQSPEGITTIRGVLRRFNDFLKLFSVLKRAFPKKNIPPTPPKGLLRIKSRALLEERRCYLEEWMTKLLSDIDLSRSATVASFLELEAAARSSFQDENEKKSEANPSMNGTVSPLQVHPNSSLSILAGSTSAASDYGSDTAYETSEIGTPNFRRDNNSSEGGTEDLSLDEDLSSPIEKLIKYGMSNIDEGLFMGEAILGQLEGLPRHKQHTRESNSVIGHCADNGNTSRTAYLADDRIERFYEPEHKVISHARKLSTESAGSDTSSLRGSELSNSGFHKSEVPVGPLGGPEVSKTMAVLDDAELQLSDIQLVLPLDQRPKMNRVLMSMQRRLATAKTDMEDLISRLNQEIAAKDYLATKVKGLEVELETIKQKSKDNLQQAILTERERVTKMQWDMEELRQKSLEMELKLKSQQREKSDTEPAVNSFTREESALQELDVTKKQLEDLLKQHKDLEVKSKADMKVLVKEVKALRRSQAELQKELDQSLKEKSEAETFLQMEKQRGEYAIIATQNLLHECSILHNRLQECTINFVIENGDKVVVDSSSLSDALDLLVTSDNQIAALLEEVEFLVQGSGEKTSPLDEELRKMLKDIFTDNARLRKQVNSVLGCALKMGSQVEKDDKADAPRNIQSEEDVEADPSKTAVQTTVIDR